MYAAPGAFGLCKIAPLFGQMSKVVLRHRSNLAQLPDEKIGKPLLRFLCRRLLGALNLWLLHRLRVLQLWLRMLGRRLLGRGCFAVKSSLLGPYKCTQGLQLRFQVLKSAVMFLLEPLNKRFELTLRIIDLSIEQIGTVS